MADKYLFPVGIDAQTSGFQNLQNQLDELEKQGGETSAALTNDFKKSAQAAAGMDTAIKKANDTLGKTAATARTLEKEIKDVAGVTKTVDNEGVNRFRRSWEGVVNFLKVGKTNVKDFFAGVKLGVRDAIADLKRFEAEAEKAAKAPKPTGQPRGTDGRFTGAGSSNTQDILNFATGGLIAGGITGLLNGVKQLGSEIISTAGKFQRFEAVLTNSLGSRSDAQESLRLITDFAATTPFAVDEITDSFIKLVNRGFKPTREELTQIGDLAASQGKSLNQLVEAVLDAQSGEFERLKEFGIRAKTVGENVILAFRGIERQVKKTDEEGLRNAVLSFGKLSGVAGSMAAVSRTLEGRLSNLSDTVSAVFKNIGDSTGGILNSAVDTLQAFADVIKEATAVPFADTLRSQQAELNALVTSLANVNDNEQFRSRLISEISTKYPEFLRLVDLERATNEQLFGVLSRVNREYETKIRLAALDERSNKLAKDQSDLFNKQLDALKQIGPQLEAIGVTTADFFRFDKAKQDQVIQQAIKNAQDQLKKFSQELPQDAQLAGARSQIRERQGELNQQLQQLQTFEKTFSDITKQRNEVEEIKNALVQNQKNLNAAALKVEQDKLATMEKQAKTSQSLTKEQVKQRDNQIAAQKSIVAGLQSQVDRDNGVVAPKSTPGLSEAELRKLEAAARKAEELERKRNDQLVKLAQELRDAEIAVMADGYEKQKKMIEDNYKSKIENVEKEKALTKSAAEQQKNLVVALEKARDAELERLRLEQIKKEAELQAEARKVQLEFSPDSPAKQKEIINLEFDARAAQIKERFKTEAALRDSLLADLERSRRGALNGVDLNTTLINISEQERDSLASLELLRKYGNNTVKQERAIQLQILQVKADAAKAVLDALILSGKGENDQQVRNAKELFDNLSAEITAFKGQVQQEKTTIFDIFGLKITEEEQQQLTQSFGVIMDSLTSIWENSINTQLQLKQQQIDLIDDQISKLEEQFDTEKELADAGLANNLAAVTAELEMKKKAREEEQRQLEEIQAKQNKAARAQIAINGLVQVSNLVLSATEAFKAHSGIPFVGIAFAIAAVATMFATFAAMKAKAAELSRPQTFRQGGPIRSGKDHAQGGIKYYGDNNDVMELEVGEYVVNRRSAHKYAAMIEAINTDTLEQYMKGNDWLAKQLEGTGVSLPEDSRRETLALGRMVHTREIIRERETAQQDENAARLDKIEGHLAFMADKTRTDAKHYETPTHYVKETNNRTTKKRKLNGTNS